MVQRNKLLKEVIKKKGNWHFKELYHFIFEFLEDEGYELAENKYTEKLSSAGKEIILDWTAEKEVSDYFKNIISLKWHILSMTDAEVEVDGKIEKTNNGEVKITIEGYLEKDYEQRWEDRPLWKFLRGVYDKYILRTTIDEYEDRLEEDSVDLINQIKSFLRLSN